jgi:hypothetical protein
MKVKFTADNIDPESLKAALERETSGSETVPLKVEQSDDRAIETAIVVAIVTATAGMLKILITSALGVAKARAAQKIIVQTKLGRIEAPANLPTEEIDNLVDRITPIATEELNVHLA